MSEENYKVRLTANVKYGKQRYSTGDYVEIPSDEYSDFKKAELINDEFTEKIEKEIKAIDEMTVPELKEYAESNNIDLTGKKTKDEILEVINGNDDQNKSGDE